MSGAGGGEAELDFKDVSDIITRHPHVIHPELLNALVGAALQTELRRDAEKIQEQQSSGKLARIVGWAIRRQV